METRLEKYGYSTNAVLPIYNNWHFVYRQEEIMSENNANDN
jgi:hypothetical protein